MDLCYQNKSKIRAGAKFVYVSQLDVLGNRSKAAGPIELVNNYVT